MRGIQKETLMPSLHLIVTRDKAYPVINYPTVVTILKIKISTSKNSNTTPNHNMV